MNKIKKSAAAGPDGLHMAIFAEGCDRSPSTTSTSDDERDAEISRRELLAKMTALKFSPIQLCIK